MPSCIINNCTSMTGVKKPDEAHVIMHPFPKNVGKIKAWLVQTKQSFCDVELLAQNIFQGNRTNKFRLCSKHFQSDCYLTFQGKKWLREEALPSIFPAVEEGELLIEETLKKKRPKRRWAEITVTIEPSTDSDAEISVTHKPSVGLDAEITVKSEPIAGLDAEITVKTEPDAGLGTEIPVKSEPSMGLDAEIPVKSEPCISIKHEGQSQLEPFFPTKCVATQTDADLTNSDVIIRGPILSVKVEEDDGSYPT